MFQEIDSNGLVVIASCLLDIGPKLDRKILFKDYYKIIIKTNGKSSFTLRMPILTQGS